MNRCTKPQVLITLSGPDLWAIAEAFWDRMGDKFDPQLEHDVMYPGKRWRNVPKDWRDRLPWRSARFSVSTGDGVTRQRMGIDDRTVSLFIPTLYLPFEPDLLLEFLKELPFTIASIGPAYSEWRKSEFERENPRILRRFGQNHGTLGFGAVFKNEGHLQVTSRRALAYGPWRCVRDDGSDMRECPIFCVNPITT